MAEKAKGVLPADEPDHTVSDAVFAAYEAVYDLEVGMKAKEEELDQVLRHSDRGWENYRAVRDDRDNERRHGWCWMTSALIAWTISVTGGVLALAGKIAWVHG